jgi:hypothetical protein
MRRHRWITAAAAVFLAVAGSAVAGDVAVKLEGFSVNVGKDGKESFSPADKMEPGGVVEYRALYVNSGKAAVKDMQAILPVPDGMEYLPGTARPARAQASLDGKKYENIPLKRQVRRADGKTEEVLVPYSEYRSLSWKFKKLSPAKQEKVLARMRILSASPSSDNTQQQAPARKESKK